MPIAPFTLFAYTPEGTSMQTYKEVTTSQLQALYPELHLTRAWTYTLVGTLDGSSHFLAEPRGLFDDAALEEARQDLAEANRIRQDFSKLLAYTNAQLQSLAPGLDDFDRPACVRLEDELMRLYRLTGEYR